ncbi:MAG TPA: hypothetical protein VGR02_10260 [Thermoanaerobaculia bacterium]|jgi:hypothetical protein|nr:hypothetical protein [Thermoanaerobaculia bacterium]
MRRALLSAVILLALVGARRRSYNPAAALALNPTRSFAVTDKAILDGFPFERFLTALVERSGTRTTALQLYQQWFDTQNAKPGLVSPDAPHCDDFTTDGKASFNGFPRRCPTPEGKLALSDPFGAPDYIPIAIMNRFDLAPADGANCGEYRIVYARVGQAKDTLHIIFEAVLPNPNGQAGLAGCKPVAQFWADLSSVSSISERRARLERFFFTGIDGFEPVIDPDHYGAGGGRARTAQMTVGQADNSTRFYQFRTSTECSGGDCRLMMMPDGLENMPHGRLFDGNDTSELATRFRDEFVTQVATLAIRDVNLFFMQLSPKYLMHESDPGGLAFIYDGPFAASQNTPAGKDFSNRIQAELTRAGSSLTPLQLINRAETQNCVGCHVLSGPIGEGVLFPPALGVEHVTERGELLDGDGGPKTRFRLSPAVQDVFLPHRMEILREFLATGKAPVHSK